MKIGIALGAQDGIAELAQTIEALGFDYLGCGEHIFAPGPTPNAFVQLAAAAGATSRIGLVSTIALLPLYPAALAAKLAATLDRVSGGRFELGVGAGGEHPYEFEAAGVEVETRFRKLEENLRVLRLLFTGETVDFDGEFNTLTDVRLSPPPMRPAGPPLWLGARKPAGIRRVGRHADVWMPYMIAPERYAEGLALARSTALEHDRGPDAVSGALFIWTSVGRDGVQARRTGIEKVSEMYRQDFGPLADRYLLLGSPQDAVARLREFRDAGADRVILQLVGGDEDRQAMLDALAEDVLPELRAP